MGARADSVQRNNARSRAPAAGTSVDYPLTRARAPRGLSTVVGHKIQSAVSRHAVTCGARRVAARYGSAKKEYSYTKYKNQKLTRIKAGYGYILPFLGNRLCDEKSFLAFSDIVE